MLHTRFSSGQKFSTFSARIFVFHDKKFSNVVFVLCYDSAERFCTVRLIRGVLMDVYVMPLAVDKADTFLRASCTCGRWCWDGMMGRYFQRRSLNSRQFSTFILPRVFVRFSGSKQLPRSPH